MSEHFIHSQLKALLKDGIHVHAGNFLLFFSQGSTFY